MFKQVHHARKYHSCTIHSPTQDILCVSTNCMLLTFFHYHKYTWCCNPNEHCAGATWQQKILASCSPSRRWTRWRGRGLCSSILHNDAGPCAGTSSNTAPGPKGPIQQTATQLELVRARTTSSNVQYNSTAGLWKHTIGKLLTERSGTGCPALALTVQLVATDTRIL